MISSKRSSITNALASKDAVAKVCFPLRRGCHVSSSRLMRLSLLENKDGIRTIEMILVSTILIFLSSCPLIYFGSATRFGSSSHFRVPKKTHGHPSTNSNCKSLDHIWTFTGITSQKSCTHNCTAALPWQHVLGAVAVHVECILQRVLPL